MTPSGSESQPIYAVTGASGFVGRAVVRALRSAGREVRALVRRPEAVGPLVALGARPHAGDLERPGTLDGFVGVGDIVIHAAAKVDLTGRWPDFVRTTIDGTRHLLNAIARRRAGRLVYVSSAAVYARPSSGDRDGLCADRTAARPAEHNLYGRAKLAAENLVRERCAELGVESVILRLGFVYGPGNDGFHRTLARRLVRRKVRFVGDGSNAIATLSIDDAVAAILLAAEHEVAAGRTYDVASDEVVTQREFLCGLADALGAPLPWRTISHRRALQIAGWLERVGGWLGRYPAITRAAVDLFGAEQRLDCSAIRSELGWTARVRFRDGLAALRRAARDECVGGEPTQPVDQLERA